MIAKNKPVTEIIAELNEAVKPMIGKRVQLGSYPNRKGTVDLHGTIAELTNPILEEYGLQQRVWRVDFLDYKDQPKEMSYDKYLIQYNHIINPDNRIKREVVGELTYLCFGCPAYIKDDTTLGDLIRILTIESIEDSLKNLVEWMDKQQKEISEGKLRGYKLSKELVRLQEGSEQ